MIKLQTAGAPCPSSDITIDKDESFTCVITETLTLDPQSKNAPIYNQLIGPEAGIFISAVKATPPKCEINWDEFNSAQDLGCFESRSQLLEQIPDKVRGNWVMMHTTRSNQRSATIDTPRVILMAPNGKFILGLETISGSQEVEIAVFDFNKNTWDFAAIDYNSQRIESKLCKTCHTENPRPIWTGYANWPGAIGDRDDITEQDLKLLNAAKDDNTSEVYKHLRFKKNYAKGGGLGPSVSYGENGSNQIMNFFLAKNAGRALTLQVMQNPKISAQKKLEIAYTIACSEDYQGIQDILTEYGYAYQDFFGFHKNGDKETRMWIGFNPVDFPAGILLLDALLKEDEQLAKRFPELAQALRDPRLKPLFHTNIAGHEGWSSYDFGFQRDHYNRNQAAELSCSKIKAFLAE